MLRVDTTTEQQFDIDKASLLEKCPVNIKIDSIGSGIEREIAPLLLVDLPWGEKLAKLVKFKSNRPIIEDLNTHLNARRDMSDPQKNRDIIDKTIVILHREGVIGAGYRGNTYALLNTCLLGFWPRIDIDTLQRKYPFYIAGFGDPDKENGGLPEDATLYSRDGILVYFDPRLTSLRNMKLDDILTKFNDGKGTDIKFINPEHIRFVVPTEKDRTALLFAIHSVLTKVGVDIEYSLGNIENQRLLDELSRRIKSCEGIASGEDIIN